MYAHKEESGYNVNSHPVRILQTWTHVGTRSLLVTFFFLIQVWLKITSVLGRVVQSGSCVKDNVLVDLGYFPNETTPTKQNRTTTTTTTN